MSEDGKAVNLDSGEEVSMASVGLNNRIHYIDNTLSPFGAFLVWMIRNRWNGARVAIIGDCSDTDEFPWDAPGRKDVTKDAWADFLKEAWPPKGIEGPHYPAQLIRDAFHLARRNPTFDREDLMSELDMMTR